VESAIYLRDYLFGGLDTCVTPGTHVIVALPPEFAGVSLGALLSKSPPRDGNGFDLAQAEWLIKQMSFSVVTSARQYLAALPLEQRPVAPRAFLGIGDPELAPAKVAASAGSLKIPNGKIPSGLSDLDELPDTADELKAVARMFAAPGLDVMLKRRASEEAFRLRPLVEYDVIHFATHGLIREDLPGLAEAALVLTPETAEDPANDGLLTVSELSRLNFGARLVVLSACNTAKYDLTQAGIGIQDFQTAFMIGGAPTVLAALWPIQSGTTRDLVTRFFRQWRSSAAPYAADALAAATRAYLASADAPHQHPRFWAAFQIAGYGHVRGAPAK
jgi:CHAT domain-containing protein